MKSRLLFACSLPCIALLSFGWGFNQKSADSTSKPAANNTSDWPQWLGPNRNGISAEIGLLKSWPATGPKILWRIPLGEGFSGVSISQGRAYTLFAQGSDEFVVCLDAASGKELWRTRSGSTFKDMNGNGPRSTPTVHNEVVYALGAHGNLYALQTASGKKLWSHDLKKEFNTAGPSRDGGFSTSPLIEGDLLLVEAGGRAGNSFIAFDKQNGAVVWKVESDRPAFASPIAITVNGVRQIVFFSAAGAIAMSPANGKVFWRLPWKTDSDVNAATPLFIPPDKVFISSGYDVGATLQRIIAGNATARIEEIWKSKVICNLYTSSILQGDYLYGFDGGMLKCFEWNTGAEKWKQRGFGAGTLIYADGHLIVLGDKGKLALVEATPAGYKEKAAAEILDGRCITVPALAAGKLYVRNMKELVCLDLFGQL
ncbi:PQQ-like beta-propeller repeat protein [candidate division KSB1 bacterium]|nr:PQQ-like beta-propeller repeat protein [candidate division KSB1 bacterium]